MVNISEIFQKFLIFEQKNEKKICLLKFECDFKKALATLCVFDSLGTEAFVK